MNTDRQLILSDSGTHSGPVNTAVYLMTSGEYAGRYLVVVKHGGSLISERSYDRCPKISELETDGYFRKIEMSPSEKLDARLAAQRASYR